MPRYSRESKQRLSQCHKYLQDLFNNVILTFDCKILTGYRGQILQNAYYSANPQRSKVMWPNGKHNQIPSIAVDAAPWFPQEPHIRWTKKWLPRYYYFGGYVKGMAASMGIPLRWGGDWDDDTQVLDQRFKDLVHFELPPMKIGYQDD